MIAEISRLFKKKKQNSYFLWNCPNTASRKIIHLAVVLPDLSCTCWFKKHCGQIFCISKYIAQNPLCTCKADSSSLRFHWIN